MVDFADLARQPSVIGEAADHCTPDSKWRSLQARPARELTKHVATQILLTCGNILPLVAIAAPALPTFAGQFTATADQSLTPLRLMTERKNYAIVFTLPELLWWATWGLML